MSINLDFNRGPDGSGGMGFNIELLIAERRRADEAEIRVRAEEARRYFNNLPNFRYEDLVASGAYGVALRVRHTSTTGRSRKLIVKRARSNRLARELRDEIDVMSKLNGSAHIASVIAYRDDLVDEHQQRRFKFLRRVIKRFRRKRPSNFLAGLTGPTLILEYLPNGTVNQFRVKVRNKAIEDGSVAIPNRILWSIFLCLVRACVAMNHPPNQPPGTAPELEEIVEIGPVPYANYYHGDMHPGNILFGATGDFPEHAVIPPAKLIDFGLAIQDATSVMRNIMDISKNVMWLILLRLSPLGRLPIDHQGVYTLGLPLLAPQFLEQHPTLDLDLRDLLIRCLAADPMQRPSLPELLQAAKSAVRRKDASFYGPAAPQESDGAIRRFVQEYIYDA
ncbi:kinase-like domain-containing protein [Ustulina deusta]|nr:kinase-like domain-containing protein [Ustulina deusta]